jgi:glutamate--cysteine ligase
LRKKLYFFAIFFVDLFLLWCLVQDSPEISTLECQQVQRNSERVALNGRDPNLTIRHGGRDQLLPALAQTLMESIAEFAVTIDKNTGTDCYQKACQQQQDKIDDVRLTPSHQVLAQITEQSSYLNFSLKQSAQFAAHFSQPLAPEQVAFWQRETAASVGRQRDIEANDSGTFDDFLAEYLRQ